MIHHPKHPVCFFAQWHVLKSIHFLYQHIFSFEELRKSKHIFNPSLSKSFYDDDDGTLKSIREGNHTLLTFQTCVYTHIQSCDVAAVVVVAAATVVVVIKIQDNIN